jgi:hypothetical protein
MKKNGLNAKVFNPFFLLVSDQSIPYRVQSPFPILVD